MNQDLYINFVPTGSEKAVKVFVGEDESKKLLETFEGDIEEMRGNIEAHLNNKPEYLFVGRVAVNVKNVSALWLSFS